LLVALPFTFYVHHITLTLVAPRSRLVAFYTFGWLHCPFTRYTRWLLVYVALRCFTTLLRVGRRLVIVGYGLRCFTLLLAFTFVVTFVAVCVVVCCCCYIWRCCVYGRVCWLHVVTVTFIPTRCLLVVIVVGLRLLLLVWLRLLRCCWFTFGWLVYRLLRCALDLFVAFIYVYHVVALGLPVALFTGYVVALLFVRWVLILLVVRYVTFTFTFTVWLLRCYVDVLHALPRCVVVAVVCCSLVTVGC